MPTLPPIFAASALYDNLLQAALRQFFSRATFETEPIPSLSSDGRLAIEPTGDPSVLSVRWFGSRHVLHVPPRRPFTEHEVRLAKRHRRGARGALSCGIRSQADAGTPGSLPGRDRGSLHRRVPGLDVLRRAVAGASRCHRQCHRGAARRGAFQLREPLDLVGRAACSTATRTASRAAEAAESGLYYTQSLTGIKSFYRLCDGLNTVYLVSRAGQVLDVIEVGLRSHDGSLDIPCPTPYRPHAHATERTRDVCIVLSPSHEIKVFAEGAQLFSFRNARWHLLDVAEKYKMWAASVGNPHAGGTSLPDGDRPRRCARGRAVRRAQGSRVVTASARRSRRSTGHRSTDGKPG